MALLSIVGGSSEHIIQQVVPVPVPGLWGHLRPLLWQQQGHGGGDGGGGGDGDGDGV